MKDDETVYIRCRTCGSYVEENQSINRLYCSEQCTHTFTRCLNCGNFFTNTAEARKSGFCSTECEAVYGEDGIIISSNDVSPKTAGFPETLENLTDNQVLEEKPK